MLAVTAYQWFNAAHVLAAVLWVGGGVLLLMYGELTARERDPVQMAHFARKAALVGQRYFTPLSFLVLGFGFALVHEGGWGYDQFFVQWGLTAWAVSAGIGIFFLGPESARLGKLLAARPADDPEVQNRIKRIIAIARVDDVILLATVFVMAAKPFL